MRKILSLMVVAIMLFSTLVLTSCDTIAKLLNREENPPKTTITNNEEKNPPRTTITKDEWLALWHNTSNYTMTLKTELKRPDAPSDDREPENDYEPTFLSQTIMVTENAIKVVENGETGEYAALIDGVTYLVRHSSTGEWIYYVSTLYEFPMTLSSLLGGAFDEMFESFVYDEDNKSYVIEDDSGKMEFFFENGKLIKTKAPGDSLIIENVGTTVIDLPEFKLGEGDPFED